MKPSSIPLLLQRDVISILFGSYIFLKALRLNCLVCVLPSVRGTKLHVVILYTLADQHSERNCNNHSPKESRFDNWTTLKQLAPPKRRNFYTNVHRAMCQKTGKSFWGGG
jgi:hypothetical protein